MYVYVINIINFYIPIHALFQKKKHIHNDVHILSVINYNFLFILQDYIYVYSRYRYTYFIYFVVTIYIIA